MLFSQRVNITQFMKIKVLNEQDIEEFEPQKIINLTDIYLYEAFLKNILKL